MRTTALLVRADHPRGPAQAGHVAIFHAAIEYLTRGKVRCALRVDGEV